MHFDTDTLLDGCMVACTRNKSVECLPPFHFCSFPRCPCDCEAHWFGAVEGEIRSLPCEDLPCHHFRSETFRHTTSWMRFQRNHICHQSRISARREPMDMCNQLTRAVDATDIERFDHGAVNIVGRGCHSGGESVAVLPGRSPGYLFCPFGQM